MNFTNKPVNQHSRKSSKWMILFDFHIFFKLGSLKPPTRKHSFLSPRDPWHVVLFTYYFGYQPPTAGPTHRWKFTPKIQVWTKPELLRDPLQAVYLGDHCLGKNDSSWGTWKVHKMYYYPEKRSNGIRKKGGMMIFVGGGNFKYFFGMFNPCLGKMNPFWRAYFSKGLKPPTSFWFVSGERSSNFRISSRWENFRGEMPFSQFLLMWY